MAVFQYVQVGKQAAATIEAADRPSALRELLTRGVTPASLEEVSPARVAGPSASFSLRATMSRAETASFFRELATAIDAGLPLVTALKTLTKQGRNDRQRAMLGRVIADVEQGNSLAEAFESVGKPFTDLTVNMVRAGDVSGKLGEVLTHVAELQEKDLRLRRQILSATLYPLILLSLIVVAVIVIVTVIVPKVLGQVEGVNMELPLPTLLVKGVADFMNTWWWAIVPGILIGVLALRALYRTPQWRMRIDTALIKAPIIGKLLRDVAVARFTRTLGTLTASGVSVLHALRITRGTLGNKAMEGVIDDVVDLVSAGRTIADTMDRSGYFPPMLVQIVSMGERSGRLDALLMRAADAFEERTEMSVKVFTTVLQPLLVMVMAGMVGFIVLAVVLPLIEMQDAMLAT